MSKLLKGTAFMLAILYSAESFAIRWSIWRDPYSGDVGVKNGVPIKGDTVIKTKSKRAAKKLAKQLNKIEKQSDA